MKPTSLSWRFSRERLLINLRRLARNKLTHGKNTVNNIILNMRRFLKCGSMPSKADGCTYIRNANTYEVISNG